MRVLTFTHLYPNRLQPNRGIFVKQRMVAAVRRGYMDMDVVAPVPYFPALPFETKWKSFSEIDRFENQDGISVFHPRYIVVPKVGMRTHGATMVRSSRRLVQKLNAGSAYDLIDAHWIYPDGYAAVMLAREIGVPVVVSARGNDINEYLEYKPIRRRILWTLQECDHVISVCHALKEMMVNHGVPPGKISVVGNGVDISRFYPTSRREAREEVGLPHDRRILLSVGLLEQRKGHHILIKALSRLRSGSGMLPKLYIIGAGPLKPFLRELIKETGGQDDVVIVGEVPNNDLRRWYNAADLLCLASDREGAPNVILESLGCGTPVVASNVFGIPEMLIPGETGLLVDRRSPDAFAASIDCALQKDWNRQELLAFALSHTWDRTACELDRVFRRILTSRKDVMTCARSA